MPYAQFIIATHSPILMAFSDAASYSVDAATIQPVAYHELEHVVVTLSFLEIHSAI